MATAKEKAEAVENMNINSKLVLIQNELKAPKNKYNEFGKFYYRNTESVFEGVKPLLKKYGCTLHVDDEIMNIGDRFYVKSTVIITDCVSGESVKSTGFAREDLTKKGMDGSMITGATTSYARKYALGGLLLLDDTEDNDSEALAVAANHAAEQEQRIAQNPEEQAAKKAAKDELYALCVKYNLDKAKVIAGSKLNAKSTSEDVKAAVTTAKGWIKEGRDLSSIMATE